MGCGPPMRNRVSGRCVANTSSSRNHLSRGGVCGEVWLVDTDNRTTFGCRRCTALKSAFGAGSGPRKSVNHPNRRASNIAMFSMMSWRSPGMQEQRRVGAWLGGSGRSRIRRTMKSRVAREERCSWSSLHRPDSHSSPILRRKGKIKVSMTTDNPYSAKERESASSIMLTHPLSPASINFANDSSISSLPSARIVPDSDNISVV